MGSYVPRSRLPAQEGHGRGFAWLRLEYGRPMSPDEQNGLSTPRQAIENGADYLVIGRPITQATEPVEMLSRLNKDIEDIRDVSHFDNF